NRQKPERLFSPAKALKSNCEATVLTSPSSAVIAFPATQHWQQGRETISRQLVADTRLSPAATRIFHFILWHANRKTCGWALLVATIATKLGISERHVQRCLAELEKYGYLSREFRYKQSTIYTIPLKFSGDSCVTPDGSRVTPVSPLGVTPVSPL